MSPLPAEVSGASEGHGASGHEKPRILLVGAGGLGSPVALALCAAGVPLLLRLVDDDRVELSNLHRQLLHREADLGQRKVDSAQATLARRSAGSKRAHMDGAAPLEVEAVPTRFTDESAAALLRGCAVVVDGSDSVATKFLVSDWAVRLGVPAVIGGVVRFTGQIMTVLAGGGCYRCLFEEPPPPELVQSCEQAGVLGPACGVIGALQAAEVLRLVRGEAPAYGAALLSADLLSLRLRRIAVPRRSDCPACAAASGGTGALAPPRPLSQTTAPR